MAWTLSYQIHGDLNNSGSRTRFLNVLNGMALPNAVSKLDEGHPIPWGEARWNDFSCDVTPYFNPSQDNVLYCGSYLGSQEYNDYGVIRRLKIQGDQDVYYGEYPKGVPYTEAQYNSGKYGPDASNGITYEYVAGDGDFPPQQWDQALKVMTRSPIGPDGTGSTDRCWFYFTVVAPPYVQPELALVEIGQPGIKARTCWDW